MRGHNQVWVSGNVGGNIVSGKTKDSDPACSFSVAVDDGFRDTTWARVNAYGKMAMVCEKRLDKGIYVSVVGELMNRKGRHGELLEVRALNILFFSGPGSFTKEKDDEQE